MVPTPHNAAQKEDFAKTILMPGDPMRAKYIAENFLEDAKLVNNIRGVQGYTGIWHDKRVSVMASGMGIPSISLYAFELFNFYDVDSIIRVGTVGGLSNDIKVGDVLVAETALTDSDFYKHLKVPADYVAHPSDELLERAKVAANKLGVNAVCGKALTAELYYSMEDGYMDYWKEQGALGIEMEAAALYAHAYMANKKALALFTVSNNILTGEEMDPLLRERNLNAMIEIALECAQE